MDQVLRLLVFPLLVAEYGLSEARTVMLLSKHFLQATRQVSFWRPYLKKRQEQFVAARVALTRSQRLKELLQTSYVLIPPRLLEEAGILGVVQSKVAILDFFITFFCSPFSFFCFAASDYGPAEGLDEAEKPLAEVRRAPGHLRGQLF
jgi:hypothetical protein